jgi:hypothetical protein
VLKKAGIIVAAAATGLLAVSSVAFADTTEGNLTNDCAFGNTTGESSQMLDGGSSLLGLADLIAGVVANVPVQTNALNCNNVNVEDVIDSNSNNTTREVDVTEIEDSFNQSHHRR